MAKYQRKTEITAKQIVEDLVKTGNLESFIHEVGWYAHVYGQYGRYPRQLFQEAVVTELKKNLSHELLDKIISNIVEKEFEK